MISQIWWISPFTGSRFTTTTVCPLLWLTAVFYCSFLVCPLHPADSFSRSMWINQEEEEGKMKCILDSRKGSLEYLIHRKGCFETEIVGSGRRRSYAPTCLAGPSDISTCASPHWTATYHARLWLRGRWGLCALQAGVSESDIEQGQVGMEHSTFFHFRLLSFQTLRRYLTLLHRLVCLFK